MKKQIRNVCISFIVASVFFVMTRYIIDALDSPKLISTACLENYTSEELDFFSEVGFRHHNRVSKWEKDIKVSIIGNPMQNDVILIDSVIEELKPLIFPIHINRVNDDGNLVVEFLDDTMNCQVMGFTNFDRTSSAYSIKNVAIQIFSKTKGQCRQQCIRHEFLHAVSLNHPKRKDTGTIIESLVEFKDLDMENVKTFRYSDLDKSALKILYSDCIPIKLKRKTFLKAFQL